MKRFIIAAAVLATFSATAFAAGYKNEPDGFRGIKWGQRLSTRKDMRLLDHDKNGNRYYSRRGDKLRIGGATLQSIYYRSHRHQFEAVVISASGSGNQDALLAALKHQFGAGARANQFENKYIWDGPTTRIYVECDFMHDCSLLLQSRKIAQQETKEKAKAAARSGSDF